MMPGSSERSAHVMQRKLLTAVLIALLILFGLSACAENPTQAEQLLFTDSTQWIPVEDLIRASSADEDSQLMYIEMEDHIEVLQYYGTSPEVTIPETIAGKPVTHISLERLAAEHAGSYFNGIRKVVLPKTVIKLTWYAFSGLERLEEIEGLEYVQELGNTVFGGCYLREVFFSSVKRIDGNAFYTSSFGRFAVRDDLEVRSDMFGFSFVDEFLLIRGDGEPTLKLGEDGYSVLTADGKTLLRVLPTFHGVCYTIPDGVEVLDRDIFWLVEELQEVVIPDSVRELRQYSLFNGQRDHVIAARKGSYAWNVLSEHNDGNCRMRDLDAEEKLSDMAARVVAEVVRPDMNEWEKAFALHNWICDHMEYDRSETYYDAESVFTRGIGTCDAYARGYCALLQAAGMDGRWIPCVMSGTMHALNAVRIDGEWCYVDCTNDDTGTIGAPYYLFGFNDVLYYSVYYGGTGIKASSEKNYAPLVLGELETKKTRLVTEIQSSLDAGEKRFVLNPDSEPAIGRLDGLMLSGMMASRTWKYNGADAEILCVYDSGEKSGERGLHVSLVSAGDSGFLYKKVEGGLCLIDYPGTEEIVTVPSQINGEKVIALEGTFLGNQTIREVILPEGLLEIGDDAFDGCTRLQKVNFPSTLRRIGEAAFYYCEELTTDPILPDGVREIGEAAFAYCNSITTAVIPGWVQAPGPEAFHHCQNLSRVTLKNGVRVLAEGVFAECTSLASLTLPQTLETIVSGALTTTGICAIHLPAAVKQVDPTAFLDTPYLEELTVAEENAVYSAIGNMLLTKDGKTLVMGTRGVDPDLVTPAGVEVIGAKAFLDIPLDSITISSGVRVIGEKAFAGRNTYTSVTMADTVEEICIDAFRGNYPAQNRYYLQQGGGFNHLREIRLSRNLKKIGEGAFGSTRLKKLVIPDSVTDIDCSIINTALEIHFPATIRSIAEQKFGGFTGTEERYAIYGYAGTAAETYAEEHGWPFFDESAGITFKLKEIQLFPEEVCPLEAYLAGEPLNASEVTWSVEGSCAVLESGMLKGVEPGWGTLTAAWKGYTGSCAVMVVYSEEAHMPFIDELYGIYTSDSDSIVLVSGKSYDYKLYAWRQPSPEKTWLTAIDMKEHAVWSVGDESVLRVRDAGVVEAVGNGKTVLTAALPDGKTVSMSVIALCPELRPVPEAVPEEELGEDPYKPSRLTVRPAAIDGLLYTGAAVQLVTAGKAEGGELQYALSKETVDLPEYGWRGEIPTAYSSGTWYVWYRIIGDEEHLDLEPECIPVTVENWRYDISTDVWNGTVLLQRQSDAEEDRTAVLTLRPSPGYIPDSLTVTYRNSGNETVTIDPVWVKGLCYTFTLPEADIRVNARFSWVNVDLAALRQLSALKDIGEEAFAGISAESVFIPDGCQVIGAYAFRDCGNLKWIRIPDSVTAVDPTAFDGCGRVYVIGIPGSAAESFCDTAANCVFVEQKED